MASSVQRSRPAPYPSKARSALIRRLVVVALVLAALALLTISFRSPTAGALHDIQGAASSALRPFQIAGARIAKPFRDAYGYVDGLTAAKAQNERLKKELVTLRQEVLANSAAAKQNLQLEKLLHYEQGRTYPHGFRAVNAQVVSFPSGPFTHSLTIEAGRNAGIRVDSPVVNGGGLVGLVTNVFPETASVTVLTDPESYVPARDLKTGVRGIVHRGPGGTLILDQVSKARTVHAGDVIVTDGTRNARFPDFYPYGIPIGRIAAVGASDTATYLQVQVQPFAAVDSLDAVAALVRKHRGR
jgi:rod shape-determining protein MreC